MSYLLSFSKGDRVSEQNGYSWNILCSNLALIAAVEMEDSNTRSSRKVVAFFKNVPAQFKKRPIELYFSLLKSV